MSMDKIKKPSADEVFEIFLLALEDEKVKLAGDIGGFKVALYEGFKLFTYRKKYNEEMLFDYIEEALDAILDDEQAMQQTDYMHAQKPAGI